MQTPAFKILLPIGLCSGIIGAIISAFPINYFYAILIIWGILVLFDVI